MASDGIEVSRTVVVLGQLGLLLGRHRRVVLHGRHELNPRANVSWDQARDLLGARHPLPLVVVLLRPDLDRLQVRVGLLHDRHLCEDAHHAPVGPVQAHHALGRVDCQLLQVLIHARRADRPSN
eukprot:4463295-Pyramimonas_sp.AAC.2